MEMPCRIHTIEIEALVQELGRHSQMLDMVASLEELIQIRKLNIYASEHPVVVNSIFVFTTKSHFAKCTGVKIYSTMPSKSSIWT